MTDLYCNTEPESALQVHWVHLIIIWCGYVIGNIQNSCGDNEMLGPDWSLLDCDNVNCSLNR